MNYTTPILLAFGIGGIILHNLLNLNKLNRQNDGVINWKKYFQLERFSILISIVVVLIAVTASQEVKQIAQFGKWLGFGFVAIGYMAQSIVISFNNRAEKYIKRQDDNENQKP